MKIPITRLLIACLFLLGIPILAAPILQSGWTTTTNPTNARTALGLNALFAAKAGTNAPVLFNPDVIGNLDVTGDITGNNINAAGNFNGDGSVSASTDISAGGTISTVSTFHGDGSGLTNLPSSGGGTGIQTNAGTGINNKLTNTVLVTGAYVNNLLSTNANPVIRATVAASGGQNLIEGFTGDTTAPGWRFYISHATNGYLPASPPSVGLSFSNMNDVQYHYGFNIISPVATWPTWIRGHEMVWFNPSLEPVMEFYDRAVLTNGALGDVGFGYTVGLQTGKVDADISSQTLGFRSPKEGGTEWMSANYVTNHSGVLSLHYNSQIDFPTGTNEWFITRGNEGLIGNRGSNYLFSSGGSGTITMLKGANAQSSVLGFYVGSVNQRGLRWNGTHATEDRWEYQLANGNWKGFREDHASNHRRTYSLPDNTTLNLSNAAYRTLGTITNTSTGTDFNRSLLVQFDINLYSRGGSFRTVFACNYDNSHSTWQELLPLHYSESTDAKRVAIDVRYNSNQYEFRLRRVGPTDDVGGGDSFQGTVVVYAVDPDDLSDDFLWITDVSGSGQGATVTQIDASTPMIQLGGKVGIGTNNPQAALHVVGNTLVTGYITPTNGILWQGGAQLTNIYTATATLDFGNAATIGCSDLTMTVTGAAIGDVVDLGVPNASVVANSSFSAWVSAADTVTVRFCALISGDPPSGLFRAEVHKWK